MMKSKKTGRKAKGHFKAKKAAGKKAAKARTAAMATRSDPPLSAREKARVQESVQNIKEGKYRDFAGVDEIWEAEYT